MLDSKISRFFFFSIFWEVASLTPKAPKGATSVTLYDFEIGLDFKNRTKNNHSTSIKKTEKNLHYFSIPLNPSSSQFMAAGYANLFVFIQIRKNIGLRIRIRIHCIRNILASQIRIRKNMRIHGTQPAKY